MAYCLGIADVTCAEPFDPDEDSSAPSRIAQAVEPIHEFGGLTDFNHVMRVSAGIYELKIGAPKSLSRATHA